MISVIISLHYFSYISASHFHKLQQSSAYPASTSDSKQLKSSFSLLIFSFSFFLSFSFLTHYWGCFFFVQPLESKKGAYYSTMPDFSHILPPFYSPCYYPISSGSSFLHIWSMNMSLPNQDPFECKGTLCRIEEKAVNTYSRTTVILWLSFASEYMITVNCFLPSCN